ncbi:glycosyltransferase family 2 protein [Microbacterium invictum]|uniref:Glycosyltransferase involved in cell wall biosynthesis n=1 Tax=Microbacterium invictum TaxID=515415 RepID=A0AA40VMG0_9MICO|nr:MULTISPECIES: glycosyltransferase family 2 protein [Microbacterium]MBB4139263.1 glycosyltransferase involved in cell wall biosynthesis [Microbacterium invictum]
MRTSVVIPSLNDAVMLRTCLAAIAVQTRPPDEVIVVDNGSTDDTADVARAAGAHVVAQPVRGIFPATTAGFDAAEGELLLRLDADSVPPADWVARIVTAFETDPGLDALSGPGRFYGGNAVTRWIAANLYLGAYPTLIRWALGHQVLFGSNLAMRTALWRDVRGRVHRDDPRAHDDFDITINLVPGTHVRYDRSLVVDVSARPFSSVGALRTRLAWALHTMAINQREMSFLARRRQWQAWTRAVDAGDPPPAPGEVSDRRGRRARRSRARARSANPRWGCARRR